MPDMRNVLDEADVIRLKRNDEGLNINQWALELGVAYRTVQKVVQGLTYADVGTLGENWATLRRVQRRGPKPGETKRPENRVPLPSTLQGKEAELRQMYEGFLARVAERYGTTRLEILRCLGTTAQDGNRIGRTAKFSTSEVEQIRARFQAGATYSELGRDYKVSRTTIARVLGRGAYRETSYTARDATPEVTDDDEG